jgi:protein-tyrosine phosphatase
MTEKASPRWVELQGAFNVRDLGGLPAAEANVTISRVLYRGDNLDALTASDVNRLIVEHRLRAVIDLRSAIERTGPPAWLAGTEVEYRHIPLLDLSGETVARFGAVLRTDGQAAYRQMVEMAGPAIAQVVSILVGPDHDSIVRDGPVLIQCAAGKDRTGIVVAVLLTAVGVSHDAVIADYLLTAERIDAVRAALRARSLYQQPPGGAPLPPITAVPMQAVLEALDREPDGVRGYLVRWGVSAEQLARLTRLMLAPRAPLSRPAAR